MKSYILVLLTLLSVFSISLSSALYAQETSNDVYTLGSGDRLRMMLYGQDDISGEYEIDGTGALTLPLIGEIIGANLSVRELEKLITAAYKRDYFVNPLVNIEVIDFRPFFILGEVKEPGKYEYISGMTVLQAVSVAGGYTYRAKKNQIKIHRIIDGKKQEILVGEEKKVFPGDVIHVEERFF